MNKVFIVLTALLCMTGTCFAGAPFVNDGSSNVYHARSGYGTCWHHADRGFNSMDAAEGAGLHACPICINDDRRFAGTLKDAEQPKPDVIPDIDKDKDSAAAGTVVPKEPESSGIITSNEALLIAVLAALVLYIVISKRSAKNNVAVAAARYEPRDNYAYEPRNYIPEHRRDYPPGPSRNYVSETYASEPRESHISTPPVVSTPAPAPSATQAVTVKQESTVAKAEPVIEKSEPVKPEPQPVEIVRERVIEHVAPRYPIYIQVIFLNGGKRYDYYPGAYEDTINVGDFVWVRAQGEKKPARVVYVSQGEKSDFAKSDIYGLCTLDEAMAYCREHYSQALPDKKIKVIDTSKVKLIEGAELF